MADSTGASRLTALEKVLSVVTAIFVLGAAVLGYQTATLTQAKDQGNSQISDLQAQNQQLQAENNQLRSQLGLSAPSDTPQPPPVVTERHSGSLTLANGASADLDAPKSNPQWSDNNGSGYTDMYNVGSRLSSQFGARALVLGNTQATYDACRNQTGYSSATIRYESLSPGQYLCWKTSEGRYVALRLTNLTDSSVTFDVVAYDPPD